MLDLTEYGWPLDQAPPEACARISAVHRGQWALITPLGEIRASLRASAYENSNALFPTVGDWVLLETDAYGTSQIIQTLPRKSLFARSDGWSARGVQAVAANFDEVFILSSLNHDLKISRLERYLAAARQSGGQERIILTKADLLDDPAQRQEIETQVRNLAGQTPVHMVSSLTGEGLDSLGPALRPGSTIVFLGSSGVGKSSLTNALAQTTLMAVNAIRDDDSRGRHTTTHRQLLRLENGLIIIDTPGMRELGLWDAQDSVQDLFQDLDALRAQCRFSDCRHLQEPGCAIQAAIASGQLTEKRWARFLQLEREAQRADRKVNQKTKNAKAKAIAKSRKRR